MNCPVNKVAAIDATFEDGAHNETQGHILVIDEPTTVQTLPAVIVIDNSGYVVNAATSQGEVTSWNTELEDSDHLKFHKDDYPSGWTINNDFDFKGFVKTDSSLIGLSVL